jgi:two-component system chemotaxis sensor kinase CheA
MDVSRYLGLFVTDAREQIAWLEGDLVRFDQTPNEEERRILLDSVFRHLHSLKGSAAAMGFDPITAIAHESERVVARARAANNLASTEVDLLLEVADALRRLVGLAGAKQPLEPDTTLLQKLSGLSGTPPPVAPTTAIAIPQTPHTCVRVQISSKSLTPAARAFVVLRRLEALGRTFSCMPPREALRDGNLPGNALTVVLEGVHDLTSLQNAVARVPDVEAIELSPQDRKDEPAPAPLVRPAQEQKVPTDQTIRVRVDLLDQLLEMAGELVLSSARLRETARRLPARQRGPVDEEIDRLGRLVKDLNARVLATRQTPVQHLADRLPRIVRDLSRRLNKPLQLVVEGRDVTLDQGLLDALTDPLTHALRNAADHGIESPEVRRQLGKPAVGTITLSARRERERVVVELSDDGGGFDVARLRHRALQAGAISADEAAAMTDDEALRLAFLPGVSTRDVSSDVSGRGVGMDAVLVAVEHLGGSVTLQSTLGVGSSVLFSLPMALSVTNLLLVDLDGEILGMPMSKVLFATEGDAVPVGPEHSPTRVLQVGDEHVVAYSLGRLVGFPESTTGRRPFVVVEGEGQRAAVGVDKLLGQEEVVMRPLTPPLEKIRGLAGTAILGSGRPIFVLDVPRLVA